MNLLTSSKNWKIVNIGQLGKVVTGKTPSKDNPQDWGGDFDFITPSDIVSGEKYISNVSRKISETGSTRFKNLMIPPDSTVVTCIGSDMGKVILNRNNALTNQQINSIIVNNNFDKNFVYYSLKHLYPVLRNSAGGGSTMPILNKTAFESLEIKIPESLEEQKEIAEMLGSLDDKIELLRKENKTLENIAQTLFKEWFVDFNFPGSTGKMIDSEFGEIPEGWKVETLGKEADEIVRGFTTEYVEKSNLINLNQKVNKGHYLDKQYFKYYSNETVIPNNKIIKKYDILLNSLGEGTLGRVYLYREDTNNVIADQHITILRFPSYLFFYIYQTLISDDGQFRLMNGISGSTGMLMLNINMVRNFNVIIPKGEVLNSFYSLCVSLYEKMANNEKQIESLSKLRDELLNKIFTN